MNNSEHSQQAVPTSALLERKVSRRMLFGATLGGGALGALSLAGCGGGGTQDIPVNTISQSTRQQELDVLNFALNLEYLEAEAYSIALNGTRLDGSVQTGMGTQGGTTGGRQVTFTDPLLRNYTAEILSDELAHILLLRSILGSQAIAKPAINLDALGVGFGSEIEFVALSRAFTDTGLSAYAGSSRLLVEPDFQETGARLLAAEGYHAGNIRLQAVQKNVPPTLVPPLDSLDQPPAVGNFFDTIDQSLAIARPAALVATIVRGPNPAGGKFFPSGLNGNIR